MEAVVQFSHALADETRWRILHLVCTDALCVCELAEVLEMPQSSVSSHLQVIRKAGLLDSERCEKWIYYRLASKFRPLLEAIRESFPTSKSGMTTLKRDAKKAAKRLSLRAETCCPGPVELANIGPARGSKVK